MKIKLSAFLKHSFAFFAFTLILVGCVKDDNRDDYDTKIMFLNTIDERAQDFYLNGKKVAESVGFSSNSSYITAVGDKEYNISAKNLGTQIISDSIKYQFQTGKNYSVYYTKTSTTDSTLIVLEDDLTPDTSMAKVRFLNLGHTLTSKVNIRNKNSSFTKILGYGEKTEYIFLPINESSKLYFNLLNSTSVIDSINPSSLTKGRTHTILIDGVNKGNDRGKLKERVIVNSN